MLKKVQQKNHFMGSFPCGTDLLEELTGICEKENISLGRIEVIGAVQKARFGYYNQKSREYQFIEKNEELEILKCSGNISVNDGKPMVHAHIILANEKGNAFGGHLAKGTIVFAGEFLIQSFEGADFIREFDEKTNLRLWK
jgi:predicted DNA-binding protein with PD1-like motif